MSWMRVVLELARSRAFPEGSHRHGYEFVLPLDKAGQLDRHAYTAAPELCTVRRFWEGSEDHVGTITRERGERWMFSFHLGEMEDESIPHFTEHRFREGEYLAVREIEGGEHTFRIVLVEPAPGLPGAQR